MSIRWIIGLILLIVAIAIIVRIAIGIAFTLIYWALPIIAIVVLLYYAQKLMSAGTRD